MTTPREFGSVPKSSLPATPQAPTDSKKKKDAIPTNLILLGGPGSHQENVASIIMTGLGLCAMYPIARHRDLPPVMKMEQKGFTDTILTIGTSDDTASVKDTIAHMATMIQCKKGMVLFNYPRNLEEARELAALVQVTRVVSLEIPDTEVIERSRNPWYHAKSGRYYREISNPSRVFGIDDFTGEPLQQVREADVFVDISRDAAHKELAAYHKAVDPVKEFYRQQGLLVLSSANSADPGKAALDAVLNASKKNRPWWKFW